MGHCWNCAVLNADARSPPRSTVGACNSAQGTPPIDPNQHAKFILDQSTGSGSVQPEQPSPSMSEEEMRAVMREMGRRGGLKGGKARAASMTSKKRKEIAQKAAKARLIKQLR